MHNENLQHFNDTRYSTIVNKRLQYRCRSFFGMSTQLYRIFIFWIDMFYRVSFTLHSALTLSLSSSVYFSLTLFIAGLCIFLVTSPLCTRFSLVHGWFKPLTNWKQNIFRSICTTTSLQTFIIFVARGNFFFCCRFKLKSDIKYSGYQTTMRFSRIELWNIDNNLLSYVPNSKYIKLKNQLEKRSMKPTISRRFLWKNWINN